MKYKSIFISDVHIGSSHCNVDKLLTFLKDNEFENIFLVGDIIDGWLLRSRWKWTQYDNLFIQKILRQKRHGVNVIYLWGNHDDFLQHFNGFDFGGIPILREYIYHSFGRRYLLVHGDQFDGAVRFCPRLQKLGSVVYEMAMFISFLLRLCGVRWSLSKFLKSKAKSAVQFLASYQEIVAEYAKAKQVNGVICGHIHTPDMRDFGDIQYYNIGDMVESNTVLVESVDGQLQLIPL
jgi:UDP-2,3-diacylglucosamine pyrophosphatase LpxH